MILVLLIVQVTAKTLSLDSILFREYLSVSMLSLCDDNLRLAYAKRNFFGNNSIYTSNSMVVLKDR